MKYHKQSNDIKVNISISLTIKSLKFVIRIACALEFGSP